MEKLISFVIPAYNCGDYIEKCISSIIENAIGFKNDIEIIVIDDGSTDNTKFVIEDIINKNNVSLRYYFRENGGQGAARNFGVKESTGKYIWFVDSDDWIVENSLSRLRRILVSLQPDVLVTNYNFVYEDGLVVPANVNIPSTVSKIISPLESESIFASVSCWNTPPWRLITKRSLIDDNDIFFGEGVYYEDHPYAISLMTCATNVFVDAPISYNYLQRSTSTTKVNDEKVFDFLKIRKQCLDIFSTTGLYSLAPNVVCDYIIPLNFIMAHVPVDHQPRFLKLLVEQLSLEDENFYVKFNGSDVINKIKSGQLSVHESQAGYISKLKKLKKKDFRKKLILRLKLSLKHRLKSKIIKIFSKLNQFRTQLSLNGHVSGIVHDSVLPKVGDNTVVHDTFIDVRVNREPRDYVIAGHECNISGYFVFERGLGAIHIGNNSSIGSGTKIICSQKDGIRIGNNVMVSWDCTIIDTNAHSLNPDIRRNDAKDWKVGIDQGQIGIYKDWSSVASAAIEIQDDAWIGFGSTILKGVQIGKGAVVGANSVVTSDVAPYTVVAGNPAKFVKLVPKDSWSWEDIILASQGVPDLSDQLKLSFLLPNNKESLQDYNWSFEIKEIDRILKERFFESAQILDVGAGNGVMSVALAQRGYKVYSLEPDCSSIVGRGSIKSLYEKTLKQDLGDKFELVEKNVLDINLEDINNTDYMLLSGSAEDLSISEAFDVILCRQVVHHFNNPQKAMDNLYKSLKPGGMALILREHICNTEIELKDFLNGHPFHKYYGGENAYSEAAYIEFFENSGFDVDTVIRFLDSEINYFPHAKSDLINVDEELIPGRPYSFILKKREIN
ncbi:glycosyltransferase [Vibrio fluvialis]|nr:glycosyltransferase [Vibrio fluvialis]